MGKVLSFYAGTLGWQDLVDRELPHTALSDLAKAIHLLLGQLEVKDCTSNLLLTILEELIGVLPQCFQKIFAHQTPNYMLGYKTKMHLTDCFLPFLLLMFSSDSSAVACRECSPAPGAVWQQCLLHHSSQQGHQWKTLRDLQSHCLHNTGERINFLWSVKKYVKYDSTGQGYQMR